MSLTSLLHLHRSPNSFLWCKFRTNRLDQDEPIYEVSVFKFEMFPGSFRQTSLRIEAIILSNSGIHYGSTGAELSRFLELFSR